MSKREVIANFDRWSVRAHGKRAVPIEKLVYNSKGKLETVCTVDGCCYPLRDIDQIIDKEAA